MRIISYLHTFRHLKLIQIRYQLMYRICRLFPYSPGFKYLKSASAKSHVLKFHQWIEKANSFDNYSFTFLNTTYRYKTGQIDWNNNQFGKLWEYNINYMDYLLQADMEKEKGVSLINEFIEKEETNRSGMESYPISLRGINWVKFLSCHKVEDPKIDLSLYRQYTWLYRNIEYHLLANHLLENGFSLLFSAFYFNNTKFWEKAKGVVSNELKEQILNDGGHFERSPMYHQIILDRLLDAINLLSGNKLFPDQEELLALAKSKASIMLGWLEEISWSDGRISYFKDSASGIAPSTGQVVEYAGRLGVQYEKVRLSDSGYRVIDYPTYEARIDIGNISPSYNPGHSHADTFNFEIYLHRCPLVSDTGISTYEKNSRRHLERSTSSHNCCEVNGLNSSDVWGGFRVGQRAFVKIENESEEEISASHNGYRQFGITNRREFGFNEKSIVISDQIIGKKTVSAISRFHFHPDVTIALKDNIAVFKGGKLEFCGENTEAKISEYCFACGFNKLVKAPVIEVSFIRSLKSTFSFF